MGDSRVTPQPADYAGDIGIEWPDGWLGAEGFLPGWHIRFYNADGYVHTILEMVLHATADHVMWASLTMFADGDGKPLLSLPLATPDAPLATGTFPFLVTGMRTGRPGQRNPAGEQQRKLDPRLR